MKDPKFTVDDIRSISTAGAGLLKWVFAMVNYYRSAPKPVHGCLPNPITRRNECSQELLLPVAAVPKLSRVYCMQSSPRAMS